MVASDNPYLQFGTGSDPLALAALGAAVVAFALALRPKAFARARAWFAVARRAVIGLAIAAAALSAGYVAYYLRGGPRIVDAAYYYLQARTFASGAFAFHVPEPTASFNGRFLLATEAGELGVLFPPGYATALALAFRLGAPLALGPALAVGLVFLTYELARSLGAGSRGALVATGLSVLCAALRYHTADTMSHGFSAVLVALALVATLRGSIAGLVMAGLAAGFLIATRPVTGAVTVVALAAYVASRQHRVRSIATLFAGTLPGVALLLGHQHALTGEWLGSTQFAYYARADGPPGCFRYGFGAGVGCLFEHGDYVAARLPHGYGLAEGVATTLRRLLVHSVDVANFAPLALAVPLAVWLGRRDARIRLVAFLVAAVVVAYAPFYFEGSFPGGGARFFADVLPLEHALIGLLFRASAASRFVWPATLAGFALHAASQHEKLRDREGGRPMFEKAVLEGHGVERGLVFVDTDHGFALGHDPSRLSASDGVVVARARGDSLDALLWERQGRPATYRYLFEPGNRRARPHLVSYQPTPSGPRRVEAEALWPLQAAVEGWAHPSHASGTCAHGGKVLRLHSDSAHAEVRVRIPHWPAGPDAIRLGWIGPKPNVDVAWADRATQSRVSLHWRKVDADCWRSEPIVAPPIATTREPELVVRASPGLWDYVEWTEGEQDKGVDN